MEISAKILREVEFRDRLRGYDTDEVDEFLERIALGVEELQAQVAAANQRAERAERAAVETPAADDDSIRRTLVLAQRTADLAIKEAEGEAERLLEQARTQSESMMASAREQAEATRNAAEEQLRARVDQLTAEQNRLEHEVANLAALVTSERNRLADSLRDLLEHVAGLDVSAETTRHVASSPAPTQGPVISPAAPPQAPSEPVTALTDVLFSEPVEDPVDLEDEELNLSFTLPDVERQVSEDANAAVSGSTFGDDAPTEIDPDEELWDRWARSGENDVVRASEDDPLGLGKRTDNWPN